MINLQLFNVFNSDPGGIRTHDPQLRRLLLYPAELRDQYTGLFEPLRLQR